MLPYQNHRIDNLTLQGTGFKLSFGFLSKLSSFHCIITAETNMNGSNSVFLNCITDKSFASHEDIDRYLLSVYVVRHYNDKVLELPHPKMIKYVYPPTNKGMLVAPPYCCEWKKAHKLQNSNLPFNFGLCPGHTPPNFSPLFGFQQSNKSSTVCLTFKIHKEDKEVSVIINDQLFLLSTIEDVIDVASLTSELSILDIEDCKILT